MQVRSICFAVFIFVLVSPAAAKAATLYLDPATSEIGRGDATTLSVRLDTDEESRECVNAVDAVIKYTGNLDPVDVSIGSSILNVWVEEPTINKSEQTITFAGGIPNGYCGRVAGDPRLTNVLARLVFRSPGFAIGSNSDSDTATVEFAEESTAYLNDGRGTKANLTTLPATISLRQEAGSDLASPWQDEVDADNTPPEEFSITLEKSDTAFSQKYFIVFGTTDKQTGIDEYQVMEEPMKTGLGSFTWGQANAPWITTRSPYELKDQTLNSIIRVRAIDKAGNEYVATLIPDDSQRTTPYGQIALLFILVVSGLLVVVILGVVVKRIWRKRRSKPDVNEQISLEKNQSDENYE